MISLVLALTWVASIGVAQAAEIRFEPSSYRVDETAPGISVSVVVDVPECMGQIHIPESSLIIRSLTGGSNRATAGVDFEARDEAVPLGVTGNPPINIGRVIGELVIDDMEFEGSVPETFLLDLVIPDGLEVECVDDGTSFPLDDGGEATVEIVDNDEASEIAFTQGSDTVPESQGSKTYSLVRRNGSSGTVTATLMATSDLVSSISPTAVTWSDGEDGPKQFTVTFVDDNAQGGGGVVNVTFDLGGDAIKGEPRTLVITVEDDDQATALEIVGGNNQIGTVNTQLARALQVRATSASGPIADATVNWTVIGGQPLNSATTTNAEGVASTRVQLGGTAGTIQIRAQLGASGPTADFTARATTQTDTTNDTVNSACGDDPNALGGVCGFFDELPAEEKEQILEEIRPEEVASQSNVSQDSPRVQQGNIGKRLAALRGSGTRRTIGQLALNIQGQGLSPARLAKSFKHQGKDFDVYAALAAANEEVSLLLPSGGTREAASHRVAAGVQPCANLRAQPSQSSEKLQCLAPGLGVEVIEQQDGWSGIRLADGRQGWTASHLLEEQTPVAGERLAANLRPDELRGGGASADQDQDQDQGAAAAEETQAGRLGLFINGSLSIGDRPDTVNESGFDFETTGLSAGLDYRIRDGLFFGGALGYLNSDTDLVGDGGTLDAEGLSLSLYGLKFWDSGLYIQGVLGYGDNDYDLVRNIDLPRAFNGKTRFAAAGNTSGTQTSLALELGIDHSFGKTSLTGFGRFSYVDADIDGYSERGDPDGSGFYLQVLDQQIESLVSQAGIDLAWSIDVSWGVILPQLRASYLHEFEDDSRLIRARFLADPANNILSVPTDEPDRDFFNVGAGLAAQFKRGVSAFVLYDTDLDRDDLDIYNITAGIRFELR